MNDVIWERIGTVNCVSGRIWIGDPCYVSGDTPPGRFDDWGAFVQSVEGHDIAVFGFPGNPANTPGEEGEGVCIATGAPANSDFTVFVARGGDIPNSGLCRDEIAGVRIVFRHPERFVTNLFETRMSVDAGLCWIGDPLFISGKDSPLRPWPEFVDKLFAGEHEGSVYLQERGIGLCTGTGAGDGTYPVRILYAPLEDRKIMIEATVMFCEEDEEDEYGPDEEEGGFEDDDDEDEDA
jgi:hypothetical protein